MNHLRFGERLAWCFWLAFALAAGGARAQESKGIQVVPLTAAQRAEIRMEASGSAGLFIGVGEFAEDSGLPRLRYTPDDAVALAHLFVNDLQLVPAQKAVLALSGEPKSERTKAQFAGLKSAGVAVVPATLTRLFGAIDKLTTGVDSTNGFLVLSFSTHGFEEGGVAYLMPADGMRSHIQRTGIPLEELKRSLRAATSSKKLLILDACREALEGQTRGTEKMSPAFQTAFDRAEGFGVLASCSAGQLSWESQEHQQGVFTHYFIEALTEGARGSRAAYITLGDAARYCATRTRDWVRRNRSMDQIPWTEGDEPARDIPLAFDTRRQQQADREESLLEELFKASQMAPNVIAPAMVDAVRSTLRSALPEKKAELASQLELLVSHTPAARENFRRYWDAASSAAPTPPKPSSEAPTPSAPGPAVPGKPKLYILPVAFTPESRRNYPEWIENLSKQGFGNAVWQEIENMEPVRAQFEVIAQPDASDEFLQRLTTQLGGRADAGAREIPNYVLSINSNFFIRKRQALAGLSVKSVDEFVVTIYLRCYWLIKDQKPKYESGQADAVKEVPVQAAREATSKALAMLLERLRAAREQPKTSP